MKSGTKNTDRSSLIKELQKRLVKKWENDKLHDKASSLNKKFSLLNKPNAGIKK